MKKTEHPVPPVHPDPHDPAPFDDPADPDAGDEPDGDADDDPGGSGSNPPEGPPGGGD